MEYTAIFWWNEKFIIYYYIFNIISNLVKIKKIINFIVLKKLIN